MRGVTLLARRLAVHFQMPSMNGMSGRSTGHSRSVRLRSGGCASASAWRTIRRCTLSLPATPLIVPTPNSYSLRISSNSVQARASCATFFLLSIKAPCLHQQDALSPRGGPNQSIEINPPCPRLEQPIAPVRLTYRNAFFLTCFVIPSRRSCLIPGSYPSTRCRNSWDT